MEDERELCLCRRVENRLSVSALEWSEEGSSVLAASSFLGDLGKKKPTNLRVFAHTAELVLRFRGCILPVKLNLEGGVVGRAAVPGARVFTQRLVWGGGEKNVYNLTKVTGEHC